MSAYAALTSLRRALGDTLDEGGMRIVHLRGQLHALQEKVTIFLTFLKNSSTYNATHEQMSELETMMREAAYRAEDLIEIPTSGVQDSAARTKFLIILYAVVVSLVLGDRIPLIVVLGVGVGYVAAVTICTICAALLHLALPLYDFTPVNALDLRGVVKDFSNIEDILIGNDETSAHAALIALHKMLDSAGDGAQLESLREKVTFLLEFLGDASVHRRNLQNLKAKIRVVVQNAKRLIESLTPSQSAHDSSDSMNLGVFLQVSFLVALSCLPAYVLLTTITIFFMEYQMISASLKKFLLDLFIKEALGFGAIVLGVSAAQAVSLAAAATVNEEVQGSDIHNRLSNIVRDAIEIRDASGYPSDLTTTAATASTERNVVVRLESLHEGIRGIMDLLARDSRKLEVVSIVGMGGIGKTTLAKQVYEDPFIVEKYDIRAWITIPQDNSSEHSLCRQVLLGLLDSAKKLTEEIKEKDNSGLALYLYQNLKFRRYLIVMDNVWHVQIWDFLKTYLPEDHNRSRVLLTSQLNCVTSHPNTLHQVECLNADESWNLLQKKVFGAESCPDELKPIGREIVGNCEGLPLAIVAIGGLLRKDKRREAWSDIARNLNPNSGQSREISYSEILGLSYDHLPHHLRPCFLYMGVFLGDSEVSVSRLLSLWVAEGFLEPSTSKTLEEVAEENLKDLIDRNLIMVCKKSCNGKIRTCNMHGLLRDVSRRKACEEFFFHKVDLNGGVTLDRHDGTPRRLSIHFGAQPVDDLVGRLSNARSLFCSGGLFDNQAVACLGFLYLRVVDVLAVHFTKFPDSITGLALLRYLALHCDDQFPPSISKLQNLETIVHYHSSVSTYPCLPGVIWSMLNLRHIYVRPGCYLSTPPAFRLPWKSCVLEHLQTLQGIRDFRWSKGIIKRIPNLKKLGISYHVSSPEDLAAYNLESLVDLIQLENLRVIINYNNVNSGISHDPPKVSFPQGLKKLSLSLSGCGIPWATIGALQNLEALKLRCEACCEFSWETEGEFPKLRFLLLEAICLRRWETEEGHFPGLQRIVMKSCVMLEEIPFAIADIIALDMIELVDCHPSAVDSAYKIKEEQQRKNVNDVEVRVS